MNYARVARLLLLSIFAWAWLAGVFSFGLFAQEQAEAGSGGKTKVDLGMGQAAPGAVVSIPAILKAPDAVDVGTVVLEIAFPSKLLSFEKVSKAIAAEAANAEVTAVVLPQDGQSEKTVVDITVKAEKGGFIPNGSMLDLFFKVSPEAPKKDTITVENTPEVSTNGDPPNKVPVVGDPGEIIVAETTLVFGCFFYMH